MIPYAGVGSRDTPHHVCEWMTSFALWCAGRGFVLRSGAAEGADAAFERGTTLGNGLTEIYLPWARFNGHGSPLWMISAEAYACAAMFHPTWEALPLSHRKLHARNGYQVLGPDLRTPSRFVCCWTADGKASGGTGQAIRIAEAYNIPVFNLRNNNAYYEAVDFVRNLLDMNAGAII